MSAAKWAGVGFVAGAILPLGFFGFAHWAIKGIRIK
jgi:hypothetical protein